MPRLHTKDVKEATLLKCNIFLYGAMLYRNNTTGAAAGGAVIARRRLLKSLPGQNFHPSTALGTVYQEPGAWTSTDDTESTDSDVGKYFFGGGGQGPMAPASRLWKPLPQTLY